MCDDLIVEIDLEVLPMSCNITKSSSPPINIRGTKTMNLKKKNYIYHRLK